MHGTIIKRPRRVALYGGPLDGERIVWRMTDAQGSLRFHPPAFNGIVLVRPHVYRLTGIDENGFAVFRHEDVRA